MSWHKMDSIQLIIAVIKEHFEDLGYSVDIQPYSDNCNLTIVGPQGFIWLGWSAPADSTDFTLGYTLFLKDEPDYRLVLLYLGLDTI